MMTQRFVQNDDGYVAGSLIDESEKQCYDETEVFNRGAGKRM